MVWRSMTLESDTKKERKVSDHGAYINDLVDIIKNKLLFYFPFFGAFLAFLVAKSDYVLNANWFIKALCASSFLAGIAYAYIVSDALWLLERVRLIFTLEKVSDGVLFASSTEEQKTAVIEALRKFGRIYSFEDKLFRKTMYLLWLTAGSILFDIYFGKLLNSGVAALTARLYSH